MTKIQVIPFANGMGDLIRHEPLFRGIKEKFENCHLSVFCNKNKEILSRNPFIDQIFSIWCSRCDYVYNLSFSKNNAILNQVLLDKGKYKQLIGFSSPTTGTSQSVINEFLKLQEWQIGFNDLFERRKLYSTNLSTWLCKICETFPKDLKTRFYFKIEDEDYAKDYISKFSQPVIVVHATSEGKIGIDCSNYDAKTNKLLEKGNKNWQAEKFIALINKIKDKFKIVIIGSEKDNDTLDFISNQTGCEKSINSLFKNLALIKYAKYFIGVDSCPAHVALTCDIPSLIISCSMLFHCCYPIDPKVKHQYVHEPETVKNITIDKVYDSFIKLQQDNW